MSYRKALGQEREAKQLLVKYSDDILDVRRDFKTTGCLSDCQRALIKYLFEATRINIMSDVRSPNDDLLGMDALLADEELSPVLTTRKDIRDFYAVSFGNSGSSASSTV